jgi:GT2 family glycosyltransferase
MGESLIITTWNSRPFVDKCLESLVNIGYNGEVIIADSSSRDGIENILPANARLVRTRNLGWSNAVNCGVREASNDVLIVSNPDIIFNRTLFRLVELFKAMVTLQEHPYAVICPALLFESGKVQCYKRLPELIDLFIVETIIGKLLDACLGKPVWQSREQIAREGMLDPRELPTASLFITSKALLQWYPLDETLWRGEDWDLWRRMAKDQIRTVWTREAGFTHSIGHSAKNYSKTTLRRIETQSIVRYAEKWKIHPKLVRLIMGFDNQLRKLITYPES